MQRKMIWTCASKLSMVRQHVKRLNQCLLARALSLVLPPSQLSLSSIHASRVTYETPGIERLRQPRSRDIDTENLAKGTTILPETMDDLPMKADRHSSPRLNSVLGKALKLYSEGYDSSRTLGAAMGVGKDTANGYIRQLKERRLIV